MSTSSQIFRDEAIKHYRRRKDKTTLPRFMSFPVTFLLWVLLGLALVVGGIAWNDEIPIYAAAPGIVLDQHSQVAANQHDTVAALFFAASQLPKLQVGQQALVHIGASKEELASKVIKIEPAVISPNTIYQRYGFVAQVVTQPSIVVLIQLKNIPTATYAGSMIMANVKTGSQRIISMLPGLGNIVGG